MWSANAFEAAKSELGILKKVNGWSAISHIRKRYSQRNRKLRPYGKYARL